MRSKGFVRPWLFTFHRNTRDYENSQCIQVVIAHVQKLGNPANRLNLEHSFPVNRSQELRLGCCWPICSAQVIELTIIVSIL